ncbi:unnamed protein product [Ectocarpus sp. CCAP 1310/34]|nr:unnamed protein product [Ectocarpus sp. CCAP 1310/34]
MSGADVAAKAADLTTSTQGRVDNLESKVSGLTDEVQQLPGPLRAVLGKFENEGESGGAGMGAVVTGTTSARGLVEEGPHNDGITPPAQHEGRSTRPGASLVVPRIPAGVDPGTGPGSGEVMGSSSQEQPAAVGACIDYTAAEEIISSRPVAECEPVWAFQVPANGGFGRFQNTEYLYKIGSDSRDAAAARGAGRGARATYSSRREELCGAGGGAADSTPSVPVDRGKVLASRELGHHASPRRRRCAIKTTSAGHCARTIHPQQQ